MMKGDGCDSDGDGVTEVDGDGLARAMRKRDGCHGEGRLRDVIMKEDGRGWVSNG